MKKYTIIAPEAVFCFTTGYYLEAGSFGCINLTGGSPYLRTHRIHVQLEAWFGSDLIVLNDMLERMPNGKTPMDWADHVFIWGEKGFTCVNY